MSDENFYEFVCRLEELYSSGECDVITLDDIYTCEKCTKCHGGDCPVDTEKDDEDICLERFKEYCCQLVDEPQPN